MKKIIFSDQKDFSFSSAERLFNFRTAIIVGACRSGKTSLGTLIGSCEFVDNIEEPWTAKIITLISGLKIIPEGLGKEILLNFITEVCNETTLFRTQSFRPTDMSSIWSQKSNKEIIERLTKYESRKDVQDYINKNNPLYLLNLTEVQSFLDLLLKTMKGTKLINVIRNGHEVAHDCMHKGWFSNNQLEKPIKALPYKKYNYNGVLFHIPWWVSSDEEELFIKYNEYERCLYYWCQTLEPSLKKIEDLNREGKCKNITYLQLISDTRSIFSEICDYLDIVPTFKSNEIIEKLSSRERNKIYQEKVDFNLKERVNHLNEYYEL